MAASVTATSYSADDKDILGAEADYQALEANLRNQLQHLESLYPSYSHYELHSAEIGHDPYRLAALLTVLFECYTREEVQETLREIFDLQYSLQTEDITGSSTTKTVRIGESLGVVVTSGYCNCAICCGQWAGGHTASGVYPQANHTIAVDMWNPIVPMGTKVIMNGIEYTVEDTGPLERYGVAFDVYYDDHQTAQNHGHKRWEAFLADDNVKPDCVIENVTLPNLYEAPLMLEKSHFSEVVCRELGLSAPELDLQEWQEMVDRANKAASHTVEIGLAGKYVALHDAYLSVAEALRHAGFYHNVHVNIHWIDTEEITEETVEEKLAGLDGILVPGGFGSRGVEGMILAARYAREKDVPYFGICLGMQIAVIEYARHVAGIADANSGEFDEACLHKVIDFMPGQSDEIDKGGTLRLGAYPCEIRPGTTMERCYGAASISERHRHRYEFNNDYREAMQAAGLTLSGISPDGLLVETVELSDRDFFVGVQYHPEFKSRPNKPHPLFLGFVGAACKKAKTRAAQG